MNNIEQIAIEAGLISAEENGVDGTTLTAAELRFAEYIVNRCLHECYWRGMNDEIYAGQLAAAEYIEEYFGIEQ